MKKKEKQWKVYEFEDGTVSIVKGYNAREKRYQESRHGKVVSITIYNPEKS